MDSSNSETYRYELRALPSFITMTAVSRGPRKNMEDRTCRANDLSPILDLAERDIINIQKVRDVTISNENNDREDKDGSDSDEENQSEEESSQANATARFSKSEKCFMCLR